MKATYKVLELRFVIEDELTHAYVLCGPVSDGTMGIQGWHHRAFPPSVTVQQIIEGDIGGMAYLGPEWAQKSP